MNRVEKKQIAAELQERLKKSAVVILADYKGMDVEKLSALRREFHNNQVEFFVIKNSLARYAIEGTKMDDALRENLVGPTAIALSLVDPVAPAQVFAKFLKDKKTELPRLKGGYLEGKKLSNADIEALAALPDKDTLRATLLSTFIAAQSKFVRLLVAAPSAFVRVLGARGEELEKGA